MLGPEFVEAYKKRPNDPYSSSFNGDNVCKQVYNFVHQVHKKFLHKLLIFVMDLDLEYC